VGYFDRVPITRPRRKLLSQDEGIIEEGTTTIDSKGKDT
jgi:hypothetical protein